MIITSIEKQKNNEERYNIYIDGEYKLSIDIDLLYELKLKENANIELSELQALSYRNDLRKAYGVSIKLLSKTSKTVNEIRKKLKEKQFDDPVISEVIAKLMEQRYLDDERYIEAWLSSKAESEKLSKRVIYNKLIQKGLDRSLIQQKIENTNTDEYSSAYSQAVKKIKSLKGSDREIKLKLLAFLYRRGFDSDTCQRVVQDIFSTEL